MEVDELFGRGQFEVYLFAGETAAPDGSGSDRRAARRSRMSSRTRSLRRRSAATYFPSADRISIQFNETVQFDQVVVTGISLDDDDDGTADVTLLRPAARC